VYVMARVATCAVCRCLQVCNHPYLFPGAEPEPFKEGDHIWQNSGKMIVLDRFVTTQWSPCWRR
jgi:hypothetical protein